MLLFIVLAQIKLLGCYLTAASAQRFPSLSMLS